MEGSSCCVPANGLYCDEERLVAARLTNNTATAASSTHPRYSSSTSSFHNFDDADIARELFELSFDDRQKVFDDLHGVAKAGLEEERIPNFVEERIQQMNHVLDNVIPRKKKKDYIRALFLWPGLRCAKKFKLMFLRADHYHPENAARRLVRYYAEKRKLFGEEKLVKTITLDDLDEDDKKEFTLGGTVQLNVKDQAGRPIIVYDDVPGLREVPLENAARALWYSFMTTLLEDETAQLKGVVCIARMCFGPDVFMSPTWIKQTMAYDARMGDLYESALPGRTSSFHVVTDNPKLGVVLSSLLWAFGKEVRLRNRVHVGSDIENEYALLTFGIRYSGLLQHLRSGSKRLHQEYLQRRIQEETAKIVDNNNSFKSTTGGFVPFPIHLDVIFGRGKPYQDFPGNKPWNTLITQHFDGYRAKTTKFEKTCVTMEVVKAIRKKEWNVRFLLESTPGGWKILDDDTKIREKASAALQNRAKALARVSSSSSSSSSIGTKKRRWEDSSCSSITIVAEEEEDPFEPLPF